MIRRAWGNRFLRFLIVGGGNALFGYSLFAFFIYAGLHYSLAVLFSTVLGVLFNFKSTGTIVFGNKGNSRIIRFVAVYCVVYAINVFALKITGGLGVNMYIAGALLLFPVSVVSYLLNSKYVFPR